VIEEVVQLDFSGKGLDEIEARLVAAADRMVERMKSGAAGVNVGGGGAGPGAGAPGGSGGGIGAGAAAGPVAGAAAATIGAIGSGVAQGMANLTPGTVNSPTIVAREAALGAAGGLLHMGATAAGAALGSALGGPVGTAVGAAAGEALGAYAQKQFDQLSESIHRPEQATAARLAAYAGTLEAHGIHVSDKFLEQQARFGISIERKRLVAERHAERIAKETGASMSSVSFGISQLGR
jgi:hypothetical protein